MSSRSSVFMAIGRRTPLSFRTELSLRRAGSRPLSLPNGNRRARKLEHRGSGAASPGWSPGHPPLDLSRRAIGPGGIVPAQLEQSRAIGKRCQAITKNRTACTAWAMLGGLCFIFMRLASYRLVAKVLRGYESKAKDGFRKIAAEYRASLQ